jgi:formamidopyrimidine-DNA glycosylase
VAHLVKSLGPEPLSSEFTAAALINACRQSRKSAKLFLMDQRQVAGLGNIYASEALFHAHIHPATPVNRLRRSKLEALHAAIIAVLRNAVKSATIAYARPGRFQEAEEFHPAVYDKEGERCRVCGRKIRRLVQGGRSTYYCPGCQR